MTFRNRPASSVDFIGTQLIFKQSSPAPRSAGGWRELLFPVTTGSAAAAYDDAMAPVCNIYSPAGLVLSRLQIQGGVRRYRRCSGRLSGSSPYSAWRCP